MIPSFSKDSLIHHLTFDRMRMLIGKEPWLYRGNPFKEEQTETREGSDLARVIRVDVPVTSRAQAAKLEYLVLPSFQPWHTLAASITS